MLDPHGIFLIVAFSGVLFHVFIRRRADFLAASYFGILLYILPGFTGFVLDPYVAGIDPSVPVMPATYWVFIAILIGNIAFSLMYRPDANQVAEPLETDVRFDITLAVATIISLILAFWEAGSALLDPDKNNVLLNQGRFWILFGALSQICTFVGVISRRAIPLLCGLAATAFAMFVGFRSYMAITGVAVILYYVSTVGIKRVFSAKIIISSVFLVAFILIYKQVYIDIKSGDWVRAMTRLSDVDTYMNSVGQSEPFLTQAILNTVLMYDFRVPFESLASVVLALVPFLSVVVKIDPRFIGFNFQDILFPGLEYGVASNIYANFYSLFGYTGILFWIIAHNAILVWLSRATFKWNGYKRIPLFICGSILTFYIIRSDIVYNISSLNRIIYTFFGIFILYKLVALVFDVRGSRREFGRRSVLPDGGR